LDKITIPNANEMPAKKPEMLPNNSREWSSIQKINDNGTTINITAMIIFDLLIYLILGFYS
jgi:hypothetical protein